MSLRDLLYLIRRNLARMKVRVAMTAIGVLIGTAAVILLVSLGIGLQRFALQDLGSVGELTEINVYSARGMGSLMVAGGGRQTEAILNSRTLDSFSELPGVVTVTPLADLRAPGRLRLNRLEGYSSIRGIEPRSIEALNFKTAQGIARLGNWQVIAGARVAENFFNPRDGSRSSEPPDLHGQTLQLTLSRVADDGKVSERVVRLRVSGVLEPSGGQKDYSVYMAINELLELNNWATGTRINLNTEGYDQALVKVEDPRQVMAVQQEIMQAGFPAFSPQSTLQSLNQLFLVIQLVLGGIGGVALLVAGFGIANAMIMAIYERTREIGLMKAVGARNRDVMFVFLGEAGAIGMLGGIGGVVLGFVVGQIISLIANSYLTANAAQSGVTELNFPSLVHTPAWLSIFAILFSAFIGVVSGVYPALRATRLDPIAALRYE